MYEIHFTIHNVVCIVTWICCVLDRLDDVGGRWKWVNGPLYHGVEFFVVGNQSYFLWDRAWFVHEEGWVDPVGDLCHFFDYACVQEVTDEFLGEFLPVKGGPAGKKFRGSPRTFLME